MTYLIQNDSHQRSTSINGDVVLVDLRGRKGSEQKGIRPCVIVQNNVGNRNANTTIVAPLTTTNRNNLPTHVIVNVEEESVVICEQLVTIDGSRLMAKLDRLTELEMREIDKAIMVSLGVEQTA